MKKTKKVLASLAIASMLTAMVPFNVFASVPAMGTRLAGVTAYDTAQQIAQQYETATSVVLAAGMTRNSVDALAAGPLAAQLKAPILLTDGSGMLTAQAKAELERLKPSKVYVTSGTAVILPEVRTQVEAITGAGSVVALGGYDAYETSLNIAKKMVELGAKPTGLVVAGGWATPADALSAASIAAAKGMPILAVAKAGLSADQKAFVDSLTGITNSYVVGGTAVVDAAVEATLPGTVARLAGNTQYDTNLKVLQGFTGVNYEKVFVANGKTFIDALAGAPLAAQYGAPIVLADQTVDGSLATYVQGKMTGSSTVIALGGTAAVPQSVVDAVKTPVVVPTALKVTSVTAANLAKVVVVFDQKVDEDSAEDKANYDGIDVQNAELQADGKTVNLYMNNEVNSNATALDNFEDYDVTISGVKTLAGVEMDEVSFEISTKDSTIPTVLGVVAKGSQVTGIQFSEAVKNVAVVVDKDDLGTPLNVAAILAADPDTDTSDWVYANLELDGDPVTYNEMTNVTMFNATSKAGEKGTLVFKKSLTAGEHTLTFVQGADLDADKLIQDYAGYKLPPADYKFTVVNDFVAPTVASINVVDQSKVQVVFSEGMNISTTNVAQRESFFWNTTGSKTNTTKHCDEVKKIDDKTFELKFTDNALDTGKVYFFVQDVKDFSGNMIMGNVDAQIYKQEITVSANEAPKVEGVTVESDSELTVKFSTSMDEDTAEDSDNYVLKDSDGEEVDLDTITLDDDEVTIKQDAELDGGTYTLEISGVEDVIGLEMASAQTFTIKITDTTEPAGVTASYVTVDGADTVVLEFDEEMATSGDYSIADKDNYKVLIGGDDEEDLPAGTELTVLEDGKKVRIEFDAGDFDAATDDLELGYFDGSDLYTVADASGNLYTPTDVTDLVEQENELDLATADVKITSSTELEVTLSGEPGFDEVDASDFTVNINGGDDINVVSAVLDADDDTNQTLIITIDADDDEFAAGDSVTVTVNDDPQSTDLYGRAITADAVTGGDVINDISPELVGAVIVDSENMLVTFDSALDDASIGTDLPKDLIIVQGSKTWTGSEITIDGQIAGDARTVLVTIDSDVSDDVFDETQQATVKTVDEDFIDAIGANDAAIAENKDGVVTAKLAPVEVTAADNVITVKYNRAIDFDSIEDIDWAEETVSTTAEIDADGVMTFDGIHLGEISGFEDVVNDGDKIDVTISKGGNYEVVITIDDLNGVEATATGSMEFESATVVKSTSGVGASDDVIAVFDGTEFTGEPA